MSALTRILNAVGLEKRSAGEDPRFAPNVWARALPAPGGVSAQTVMSSSATAYRCVDLKATTVASVPLYLYRAMPDGSRQIVTDDPIAKVLARPNDDQTKFEFVELCSRSLDVSGQFHARIIRGADGSVQALRPLYTGTVSAERVAATGRVRYRVSPTQDQPGGVFLDYEILHVRNHTVDGINGLSPFTVARAAMRFGLNLDETAAAMIENGMTPSMVVQHSGKSSETSKKSFREGIENMNSGPRRAGRVMVLEGDVKWEAVSFNAADSQLLESRRLSAEDVCRILGVPPAALALVNTVSYGSASQAAVDLYTQTLHPLAARIEAAMERALLSPDSGLSINFDLSEFLRADPAARWQTYQIARNTNVLSINDVRRAEGYPSVQGGDEHSAPKPAPTAAAVP